MSNARQGALDRLSGKQESAAATAGSAFFCEHCMRTADCPRLPRIDEEGEPLLPSEVEEIYNQRRYAHYLRDFDTGWALREHLEARAYYWSQGKSSVHLEQNLTTVGATIEWWETAHRAMLDAVPRQLEAKL